MNDNARKWVEALRSGKYNQVQSQLVEDGAGYCCLGVACSLYAEQFPNQLQQYSNQFKVIDPDDPELVNYEVLVLPQPVMKWLGLSTNYGDYKESGQRTSLVEKNDDGLSFAQIADIIESEPEGLFV